MTLRFTDGIEFNTDCKPHIRREYDGFYVVGNGCLTPVNSRQEANELLSEELKDWERKNQNEGGR